MSGVTKQRHFTSTDHSVLVGTNKFFEIDLKNFSAEEFLDHCVMNIAEEQSDEQEYSPTLKR